MTKEAQRPAVGEAALNSIKLALGFATFAFVATAILVPASRYIPGKVQQRIVYQKPLPETSNPIMTGSVAKPKTVTYTVRRSVLQKSPDASCIISSNGTRKGDC